MTTRQETKRGEADGIGEIVGKRMAGECRSLVERRVGWYHWPHDSPRSPPAEAPLITLIKESDQLKMPWKNKQGTTAQILISPAGTSLDKLDFAYRLSSAPIKGAGPFSKFPGYQRILLPISGAGFVLNGHPYATFEAAHFSGDDDTHCELLKKEVTDLGLIYDPARLSANVRVLNLPFPLTLTLEADKTYLCYLLSGQLAAAGHPMAVNETLLISGEQSIHFDCQKKSAIAFFTLQPK